MPAALLIHQSYLKTYKRSAAVLKAARGLSTLQLLFINGGVMTENNMRRALALAQKGQGAVSPNPMVGAVIVKNGRIIGEGYHEKYGQAHAERNALAACTESPEGADLYVTLEPCTHTGKTPPCTEAILQAGIARVFIGSTDPNPTASGGAKLLREHGIEVIEGVLKEECDALNEVFLHNMTTGKPFVVLKYAMTADGHIAAANGKSKWITGEAAREHVHQNRGKYDVILAGLNTVVKDDAMLTCRVPGGHNPVRVVCDTHLNLPPIASIVRSAKDIRTIIACSEPDEQKHRLLASHGCEVWVLPEKDGHTDLSALISRLHEEGLASVYIEGGAAIAWSALEAGVVNRIHTYIAPKLFGGAGKNPIAGPGVPSPADAIQLSAPKVSVIGDDILLEMDVQCSPES